MTTCDGKIGDRIKAVRSKRGLTQDKLSKELKVSRSTISNWEINRNAPDISLVPELARLLDVSIEYILMGECCNDHRASIKEKMHKHSKRFFLIVLLLITFSYLIWMSQNLEISGQQIQNVSIEKDVLEVELSLPGYYKVTDYLLSGADGTNQLVLSLNAAVDLSMKKGKTKSISIPFYPALDVQKCETLALCNSRGKIIETYPLQR